jgi:hypothetical protein
MPEPTTPAFSRALLMPAAAVLASLTLLAVTATFVVAGWQTLAAATALAGLPIAVIGLASSAWVFVLGWQALADARHQLGRLRAEGGAEVQDPENQP